MLPGSSPQKIVYNECSSEDWLQWEKLRESTNNRDCVNQVSLLCNGPWTEWQIVPGEDCYYERSRHILYKTGDKTEPLLCDEEVVERSCDVTKECSSEDWLQWMKLRESTNSRDCVKQVSLLCNGPWNEWQIVPGEDCYYERSRYILYKAGNKAKLLLCDEEVVERSCGDVPPTVPVPTDRPRHTKLSTLSSKRPLVRTSPRSLQTSRPYNAFRTTRPMQSNKVADTSTRKQISSTTTSKEVSPALPADIQLGRSEGLAGGAVAGICLGVILLVALITLAAILVKRRRKNKKSGYYSDPDTGDMNGSTHGSTFQDISALDSRRAYESNIGLNSGIFPKFQNEVSPGQPVENDSYQHMNSPSNHKHHTFENKPSDNGRANTGYDQSDASKLPVTLKVMV